MNHFPYPDLPSSLALCKVRGKLEPVWGSDGLKEYADAVVAQFAALLPSDLGGRTVLEHLQRMAEDAARYRAVRDHARIEARDDVSNGYVVRLPMLDEHAGVYHPTFDSAVDAEIAK